MYYYPQESKYSSRYSIIFKQSLLISTIDENSEILILNRMWNLNI